MKLAGLYSTLVLLLVFAACSPGKEQETLNVNPDLVLKDFKTWWNYNYENINLSENYIALDSNAQVISKTTFLESLSSGAYTAFRLKTIDSSVKYQLYSLSASADKSISETIKQWGAQGLERYKMEGTVIPGFNFTDLNGNVYNKETTKGKIVVLKCWFVNCQPCVEEMPALNELVKQYQHRKDVVFISLAFDTKEKLAAFLKKTTFDYAVIPVDRKYMFEELKVTSFPTHFVINRAGLIVKLMNDYHDMVAVLNRELAKPH